MYNAANIGGMLSVFITFEGGDGSGKSTQAKLLYNHLIDAGYLTKLIHEPGATNYGQALRNILLERPEHQDFRISPRAQVLGFCSARAQLVAEIAKPFLKETNAILISDRYSDSTIAYQVFGLGLVNYQKEILSILDFATQGLKPDLTIFLDLDPEEALRRTKGRLKQSSEPYVFQPEQQLSYLDSNQFDRKSLFFHKSVKKGYEWAMSRAPDRWVRISAERPIDEIQKLVATAVQKVLEKSNVKSEVKEKKLLKK